MINKRIDTVIFDLGGVLVDWNPEYLYSKIFKNDPYKMNWFLENVCTKEWNMEQDAGRSFAEACELLIKKHPEYKVEIEAFHKRWEEMLQGEISGTVLILNKLKRLNKVSLYALTNWSEETFPIAQRQYEFLKLFEGIVVSGTEKTRKPFDKIYQITLERYDLSAENCLFIDDSFENIEAARKLGINTLHFTEPQKLKDELESLNLL